MLFIRSFRVYLQQTSSNFIKAILYQIRETHPWQNFSQELTNLNSIFKNIVDTLKIVLSD